MTRSSSGATGRNRGSSRRSRRPARCPRPRWSTCSTSVSACSRWCPPTSRCTRSTWCGRRSTTPGWSARSSTATAACVMEARVKSGEPVGAYPRPLGAGGAVHPPVEVQRRERWQPQRERQAVQREIDVRLARRRVARAALDHNGSRAPGVGEQRGFAHRVARRSRGPVADITQVSAHTLTRSHSRRAATPRSHGTPARPRNGARARESICRGRALRRSAPSSESADRAR